MNSIDTTATIINEYLTDKHYETEYSQPDNYRDCSTITIYKPNHNPIYIVFNHRQITIMLEDAANFDVIPIEYSDPELFHKLDKVLETT